MKKPAIILALVFSIAFCGLKYNQHVQEQERLEALRIEQELVQKRMLALELKKKEEQDRLEAKKQNAINITIWGQVYNEVPPYVNTLAKMKLHKKDK